MVPHVISQLIIRKQNHMVPHVISQLMHHDQIMKLTTQLTLLNNYLSNCVILYIKANMVFVCLFIYGDKQGRARQGRVGRPGQTPAHNKSFLVTPGKATVVVSVCVGSASKILPVIARSL